MKRFIYILLTMLASMLNCSAMDVTFSGATPQFHYYGKDHLGNNRTVVNSNGTLEQVTHYYPFGGIMGDITRKSGTVLTDPLSYPNILSFERDVVPLWWITESPHFSF